MPKLRQAIHAFTPRDPDEELKLKVGDIIVVLGKSGEDGWLIGKVKGKKKKGLFPKNFTAPYEEVEQVEEQAENSPPVTKKKKPGKLAIPALNHIEAHTKEVSRPKGNMNIELPVLRKVETTTKPSSDETTNEKVFEKPSLRHVSIYPNQKESISISTTTTLQIPALKKVELAGESLKETSSQPSSELKLPMLKKTEIPEKKTEILKDEPIQNKLQQWRRTSEIKSSAESGSQLKLPLLRKVERGDSSKQITSDVDNSKRNEAVALHKTEESELVKVESSRKLENKDIKVKVVTLKIPSRSLTSTEPPPNDFYTPKVDQYSCNVQLNQSSSMTEKIENFTIKQANRTVVKLKITQRSGEPQATCEATIEEFQTLSERQLIQAAKDYGPKIVDFCEKNFGKRVGDGESWTLAKMALESAGCAPAISFNFGQEVVLKNAEPGDILHFKNALFQFPNGTTENAGSPDHIAVCVGTMHGSLIPVFEQNPKPCSPGSYDFSCLKSGSVTVYRPIPS